MLFPYIAPKYEQKIISQMPCHTTALTSPPVTAWTPSSFHLLASQRAGCSTTFVTKNPTFNRISWPIQELSYPFDKAFMFNFILDVLSFHICFRGSRILRFYLPIFRIGFSASPHSRGSDAFNATFSSPVPPGQIRTSRRTGSLCAVNLLVSLE